jgi:hypothetical protein
MIDCILVAPRLAPQGLSWYDSYNRIGGFACRCCRQILLWVWRLFLYAEGFRKTREERGEWK